MVEPRLSYEITKNHAGGKGMKKRVCCRYAVVSYYPRTSISEG